jgi:alpha-tubulin suppressor-like RCC1 family protein
MKKDFFTENNLLVLDVSFGMEHTLVLCQDKATKKNRVYGCGQSNKGQLCNVTSIISYQFTELTHHFPDEIAQISAGSLHSLFLTKIEKKVYGCGSNSKGQLGFKSDASNKLQGKPIEIKIGTAADKLKVDLVSVHSGSLYSMALATT